MHAIARTAACLVLYTGLVAGCAGPSTGDVSGTVTFDGAPLADGAIEFVPADGKGPSTGGVITAGKYDVKKVPVGAAKVTITGVKVTGKKKMYDTPDAPWVQTATELLPEKYNKASTLTYDVTAGPQTKDFTLTK